MNYYIVNFGILLESLLPFRLRTVVGMNWLSVLTMPVARTYSEWGQFRINRNYTFAHNGQVCYFRKLLNDTFDNTLRRITIADGLYYDRVFIRLQLENQPEWLDPPLYIRTNQEYADTGYDFIIQLNGCPLNPNELLQLRNRANFFKLAGKRYIITP
jgi:hypothetical protein